jgi:hypothetical protein
VTIIDGCGSKLVTIPRWLHASYVRVYMARPRAALTALAVEGVHLAIILTALALLAKACPGELRLSSPGAR